LSIEFSEKSDKLTVRGKTYKARNMSEQARTLLDMVAKLNVALHGLQALCQLGEQFYETLIDELETEIDNGDQARH
tara:strand:- start:57 stop:284 length:228 start_codon:yes stop_codon:yes gene_type:complete